MKEFKKFFNQTQNINEKSIVKEKTFTWGDGDYSMEIAKKTTGELDFNVFYVENEIAFTIPKKDVNELNNWIIGEDQITEKLDRKIEDRIASALDITKYHKFEELLQEMLEEVEEDTGIEPDDTLEFILKQFNNR